ncbi:RNA polymerase III subunit Rpc25-domain-containing protein [Phakopsora pachyrhizi]|uniref:RNA polymerase III subunit Rpc25-domain-containing protein n=1 Tax=Phakopsora pachyrhizi TaxID=170000 RepID=A0AAV0B0Y8_PHAPC|nr:RNA polymerase III subunit Rpc25-domain-containing protein [Phakopsora pachyrhizi]KAI8456274.1 RNA polymerase III subunit Rpc25-domain-containing protein [Phakopsora pachyrhizi]CAH7675878.1 RNA polymerase III subunit Rpc25-domain-containing protein [Phakopsora pachyrhizi]CAH7689412.1 RNA polymerase III subunit Rpc25-domain-containing protein [Phakopsora pachyrhizi]
MFVLSHLKDTIKVLPRDFGNDRAKTLIAEVNRKYSNKVLPEVGLCIALFDLLYASEGKILHGDGCLYHNVEFTLAVFRPFMGESLVGTVKSSSPVGIRVSLKFFDDIHIPARSMQYPSAYDPSLNEFFWASEYSDPEAAASMPTDLLSYPEDQRLYVQVGQSIRFRIEAEHFFDVGPKEAPKAVNAAPDDAIKPITPEEQLRKERENALSPYTLIASCNGPGLGILAWWKSNDAEEQQL